MSEVKIKIDGKDYEITQELAKKFKEQIEKLHSTCVPGSIWCVNGLEHKCKSDGSGYYYTGGKC